jgi:pimeloyl-ACP methyl ester carboxylesterase
MNRTTAALCLLALLMTSGCTVAVTDEYFFHPGPADAKAFAAEPITINRGDGVTLGGVYVQNAGAPVDILYFGGDAFKIDDVGPELAKIAAQVPANLFVVDYRGYGRSNGTPTLADVKGDALAAFDALRARNGGRPVIVHGISMGSFIAAYVAANRPAGGLVLESSAPNVSAWAKNQVPWYVKPFLHVTISDALLAEDNVRALQGFRGPLLLLTGERDNVTPPRFAQEMLVKSPSAEKRVVIVPGRQHGDALLGAEAVAAYASFARLVR